MKFQIVNLGCKVNRVESDDVAASFLAAGLTPSEEHDADVVFINTCTVTGEAEKKARKAVRHSLTVHPNARVLVSGCAVAIHPSDFKDIDTDRVEVVSRANLSSYLSEFLTSCNDTDGKALRLGSDFNTRVNIKIQDGCNNACTYCIVHVARGKSTSRAFEEVVNESVRYAQNGVREIVLTGINLGSYSDSQHNLADLLRELLSATAELPDKTAPVRFRISSIEPECVTDELLSIIAQSQGRICRHLHLPLQSGNSKVLHEMARRYSAEEFTTLVKSIYKEIPAMSLSTDIIVGFPGETDQDFEDTLEISRICRFSKIHVFPYSMREGTPAASRSDQVPPEVKQARAKRLRALSDELAQEDFERRIESREMVIIEPDFALTESYHEIQRPSIGAVGDLVSVKLEAGLRRVSQID